mgnify:CR=1 FL=1
MPKIPRSLTAMAVNKLKNGRHAVGGAVGLYLDKSSSSAGSWIYRYTSPDSGKIVQMGLGSYPAVTLSQARLMAVDYRSTKELGLCPLTQRLQKQQNKNEALRKNKTFKEVALLVCELKEAELSNPKSIQQWRNTLSTYVFPTLGHKIIGELSKADIFGVLEPIWRSKHETARRLKQRIQRVFTYAKAQGWCSGDNPASDQAGLLDLLGNLKPEPNHFLALDWRKAPTFYQSIAQAKDRGSLALLFILLTAKRASECRLAKWSEFDLESGLWEIPAERMKHRRRHIEPLAKQTIIFLRSLEGGNRYVFGGSNYTGVSLAQIKKARSEWPTTTHGLRATFETYMSEQTQHDDNVLELCMSHTKTSLEKAYKRGDLINKRRSVMQDWADYLNGAQPNDYK